MDDETIDMYEWVGIATSRSEIYGFLGALYCRLPDAQFVENLRGDEFGEFLEGLAQAEDLPQGVRDGAAMIRQFALDCAGQPVDEVKTRINVERTRLLRGVKPGYGPLPPYESIYGNADRKLDANPIAEVVALYAEHDVILPKDNPDQPDYIGYEIDFMRHLCAREAAAWQEQDSERALLMLGSQRVFLTEHANKWIPAFCDEMIKDAKLDLYQGIARFTRGFLLEEEHKTAEYLEAAGNAQREAPMQREGD